MTDPDPYADLKAKAAQATAEAALLQAKAQLAKAQADLAAANQAADPQTAASSADLKAQTAQATAEAALLQAKTQLVKAQADLATASRVPDPLSAASDADLKAKTAQATAEAAMLQAKAQLVKAQTDLATASQASDPLIAASNAEKARLEAQKAAAQAALGSVTGSTAYTGSVETKQDAGKGEATLLASRAIRSAAATVAEAVTEGMAKTQRIVLMQGPDAPQFANYRQFLLQRDVTLQILAAARNEADRLSSDADELVAPGAAAQADLAPADALPLLSSADIALTAITKLGSYFMSNYEIGGITLTPDGEQLVHAVANRMFDAATLVLPARRIPRSADFTNMVGQIGDRTVAADAQATSLSAKALAAKQQADVDTTAKKTKLQDASKLYEQGSAALRKAITRAEELFAALAVADAKGVAPITRIAQEQAICDDLEKGALVLTLDVRAMAGGYYTKKNLWTFLGCIPFHVMGGAVVTYCLTDKDGVVKKAGLVPVHGGYAAIDDVPAMF